MGQDGMGQDGMGRVPLPGTSSRSEVHLVEAAGSVESFVYEPGLRGLGFPQATLVPRPRGRAGRDPSGWMHPSPVTLGRGGVCTFGCTDGAELLHFSATGMSLW